MKKTVFIVLCILVLFALFSCGEAEEETVHPDTGYFTCEFNDETKEAVITKYTGEDTDVVIPEKFGDYTVTEIGRGGFSNNYELSSVVIPESVKVIGDRAFESCMSLTEITIPSGVESIGENAFYSCRYLRSVNISETVKQLSGGVFGECKSLESITVDEDNAYFTVDEYGVLLDKEQKTLVQYPVAVTRKTYKMPNTVETVMRGAFAKAVNLNTVKFSEALKIIETSAFGESGLNSVDLSNTEIKEIGNNAFSTTKITNVKLGDELEIIGTGAFSFCYDLTEVYIPKSVNEIGAAAFTECALTKIVVDAENENYSSDSFGVLFNKDKTVLIQYPIAKEEKHYTIPSGVVEILSSAFDSAELESVTIPDSVENIQTRAFQNIISLKVTYLGTPPEKIGSKAFPDNATFVTETK